MSYDRGVARRKADESLGVGNSFQNYGRRTDSGDVVYAFAYAYSTTKMTEDERVREFTYCPIAEDFKSLGDDGVKVGELFCNHNDNAVMRGYNPDYMCRRESSLNLDEVCRLHFMKKK